MTDIRQSPRYAKYLSSLGWKVERISGISYFIKKIPLVGSVLKIQRPKRVNFDEIERLVKKHRVFQVILEPNLNLQIQDEIFKKGFKPSKSPYLPTKSLQIDLTLPKERIIAGFKKDARAAIKRGGKITFKEYSSPNEIKEFRDAWKKSVKFSRFVPPTEQLISLRKYFPDNYSLFLASHNNFGNIMGGAIFTRYSHGAYYWQAFTNSEGRSSLSQYSLLYQGILWAKKQGCKIFDFEGIFDPRFPNKSWLGFTHFKRSFGGREIIYPECYTFLRLPLG